MTPTQIKLAVYAGMAIVAWLCTRRAQAKDVHGDVELGVPTIDGVYGGGRLGGFDYYTERPSGEPSTNPATNPEMRRLIDISNRAIAEEEASS